MDALDLPQEADQEVNRILRDHFGFEKDGDIKELKLKSEVFWQEFLLDRVTEIHARGGARYSAEKFIEKGGEKAFQVVQVTEQQIMDAMIVANRHGHIACTQGGECLAGLVNARALGLVGDDEHAVLDATAHALKFSGFQDMYFNDSFPEAYGVKPQAELSNKPELLLPESAREGKDVATFARMGADAVVARLGLSRK